MYEKFNALIISSKIMHNQKSEEMPSKSKYLPIELAILSILMHWAGEFDTTRREGKHVFLVTVQECRLRNVNVKCSYKKNLF